MPGCSKNAISIVVSYVSRVLGYQGPKNPNDQIWCSRISKVAAQDYSATKRLETMQLIDEIIRDLVDENANLPNILRKAKMSCQSNPGSKEFRNLASNSNSTDYPSMNAAPRVHRSFRPENHGTFTGPWGSENPTTSFSPNRWTMKLPVKSFAQRLTLTRRCGRKTYRNARKRIGGYPRPWPQETRIIPRT